MSIASEVSICSNALVRLGGKPISSFQEDSEFAGPCATVWPTVRNMVLRAHPWNCATRRAILAPLVESPAFDFGYQFNLPTDWLKTLQVGRRNCPITYQQEGRRILANVSGLPLVYIWENTNPGTWDDSMVEAAEILMGPHTPVSIGNFGLGPNAVLPTSRWARTCGPLSVTDFVKRSSIGYVTASAYPEFAKAAWTLARYEGFSSHEHAVSAVRDAYLPKAR